MRILLQYIKLILLLFPSFCLAQDIVDSTAPPRSTISKISDLLLGRQGFGPLASYNSRDHIHVGLRYGIEKKTGRTPQEHYWAVRYSISEKDLSYGYEGIFRQLIGGWDLELAGGYDHMRWHNFFGLGNDSRLLTDERDYNRLRTRELEGYAGLRRTFGSHEVRMGMQYHSFNMFFDPGRFHTEHTPELLHYERDHFVGGSFGHVFRNINFGVVHTRGAMIESFIRYQKNTGADSSVWNFGTELNFFVPFLSSFVFSIKSGGAHLSGQPEVYQLNRIGGAQTLRGYRRWRFYGHSVFYNQAELQFIRPIFQGKNQSRIGLIGLFDFGRVWMPAENSNTWHYAYGGGIMLAPMNKVNIAIFYAVSPEEGDISLRFTTGF